MRFKRRELSSTPPCQGSPPPPDDKHLAPPPPLSLFHPAISAMRLSSSNSEASATPGPQQPPIGGRGISPEESSNYQPKAKFTLKTRLAATGPAATGLAGGASRAAEASGVGGRPKWMLDLTAIPKTPEFNETRDQNATLEKYRNQCSCVIPNALYISGEGVAKNYQQLSSHSINHVINTAGDSCPNYHEDKPGMNYLTLVIPDSRAMSPALDSLLWPVVSYIWRAIHEEKGRVLVHCREGVSRSCAFIIAYLMWSRNYTFAMAFKEVRDVRPHCNPNTGFTFILLKLAKRMNPISVKNHQIVRRRTTSTSPTDPFSVRKRRSDLRPSSPFKAGLARPPIDNDTPDSSSPKEPTSPGCETKLLRIALHHPAAPFLIPIPEAIYDSRRQVWNPTGHQAILYFDPRFSYILRLDSQLYVWRGPDVPSTSLPLVDEVLHQYKQNIIEFESTDPALVSFQPLDFGNPEVAQLFPDKVPTERISSALDCEYNFMNSAKPQRTLFTFKSWIQALNTGLFTFHPANNGGTTGSGNSKNESANNSGNFSGSSKNDSAKSSGNASGNDGPLSPPAPAPWTSSSSSVTSSPWNSSERYFTPSDLYFTGRDRATPEAKSSSPCPSPVYPPIDERVPPARRWRTSQGIAKTLKRPGTVVPPLTFHVKEQK